MAEAGGAAGSPPAGPGCGVQVVRGAGGAPGLHRGVGRAEGRGKGWEGLWGKAEGWVCRGSGMSLEGL